MTLSSFLILRKQCIIDTKLTIQTLQELGYVINFPKSHLIPKQLLDHLGVLINSVNMTVSLTSEKCDNIIKMGKQVLKKQDNSVRDIAN